MQPRHSKTSKYLNQGIFHGLKSISDLEERIDKEPLPLDRGDIFEIFTEAMLYTQRIHQVKEVWPQSTCPETIRVKLGLTFNDMGVDGVFETISGQYVAYQVKYRKGRKSPTWTDLGKFVGLGTRCDELLVVANSLKTPDTYDNQPNAHNIRGTDLDRLEEADFKAIEEWLKTGQVKSVKKTPDPYQKDAISDILQGLKNNDRLTAIMACGTGKTLVTLWAAEEYGAKNILVLVPSLALIRQTLMEWVADTSWEDFSFLCVCSDPKVSEGADAPVIKHSDLPFNVSTHPEDVRKFLVRESKGVKVVFSTYQSASVVAKGMDGLPAFELGIFDEAHKTAQRKKGSFSLALSDDNIAINKRVFCTATPRLHNVMKKDKEGDAALVYSMDNPKVYGPTVHNLSFAAAAEQGIICNYKVIISVVNTTMVNDYLLSHGGVLIEDDEIKARQVANQIAMQRTVEEYGVSKIFSFHPSIASAQSFTSTDSNEGIKTHLPKFDSYHVSGKQSTVVRDRILTEFKSSSSAIVSNARCLTEGVDVPAVDMVAFMSPKKSTVDIIQATGRAMRKPRGSSKKKIGYIFLPLYLELKAGEEPEDAVKRSGFEEIWNVLAALQDQDRTFSDAIKHMREDRGTKKGYNDSKFREKVEIIGPEVLLTELRESITISCVDKLSDTWDEKYGELKAYKSVNDNCDVPQGYTDNPPLGTWVQNQRKNKKKGKLSEEHVARLNRLGFDWDPHETVWNERYDELKAYKSENNHCNVSGRDTDNAQLAAWVAKQREDKKNGTLSEEKIARLNSLGFDWDPYETVWNERYDELKAYQSVNGNCDVPALYPDNPRLGIWVAKQRENKKKGKLSEEKMERLNSLGFDWDPLETVWNKRYDELKAYKSVNGNCNVPKRHPDYPQLAGWVAKQREDKKNGTLSEEKIVRLNSLGFDWDPYETIWNKRYDELKAYKSVNSNCAVPQRYPDNPQLATWVGKQRENKKKGKLSEEKMERLNSLGFDWDPLETVWNKRYDELKAYKSVNSNCAVPQRYPDNPQLATWVGQQRKLNKKGKLSEERVAQLDDLGFRW